MASTESLALLRELFPDWSDEDLTLCLEEARGELDTAITRISEGHATKFGEVTKRKDKTSKRVEFGNGRGRGRGAAVSTGATRGRSEFRGRGRGRGASASANGTSRNAVETTPSWTDTSAANATDKSTPASGEDATTQDKNEKSTTSRETKQPQHSKDIGEQPMSQTPNDVPNSDVKPKSKLVDKNSKSSWASVAKPSVPKGTPVSSKTASRQHLKTTDTPVASIAPLTEENLEVVTESQPNLPQPPTATVTSLVGEPATGPSSLAGAPGTPGATGPPGLKPGLAGTARGSTPTGGRKLQQDQAVVMPGAEREPTSRIGVQFGSLGLNDEDNTGDKFEKKSIPQKHDVRDLPAEIQARQDLANTRVEKPYDNFGGAYGAYGMPAQQSHPGYVSQNHEQYPHQLYGQAEQARVSPFAGHNDFYQQSHHQAQQPFNPSSTPSQRSDTVSRNADSASRFGEPGTSATTLTSQPGPMSHGSPAPGHLPGQQPGQFAMHPQQYGQPNPYAYYGYGYGYPQQQQSAYAPMYGQRGYGGQPQYQAPHVHQSVGTSQDRFERSTAEYQRHQQAQTSHNSFGSNDFLGSSRNHQQPSGDLADPFKGYNGVGATGQRDENKSGGVSGHSQSYQGSQGQYGSQTHQPAHQQGGSGYESGLGSHGQGHAQAQYSQYASNYGRSGQQQYNNNWNQGY